LYLSCFSFYVYIDEAKKNLRTTNLFDLLICWEDGEASLLSSMYEGGTLRDLHLWVVRDWKWFIIGMHFFFFFFWLLWMCGLASCSCVLNLAPCVCARNDATASSVIMLYVRVDSCDFHFILSLDGICFEWIKTKKFF